MAATKTGLLVGATFANRFRLEALIGAGPMGEVFRVVDDGKTFALKALLPRVVPGYLSVDKIRTVFAEKAAAHPAVVRPLEVGEAEGIKFLVLPCIHGASLQQLFEAMADRNQRGDATVGALIVDRLAAILEQLPGGMVHGGIKPSNVLVEGMKPEGPLPPEAAIHLTDMGGSNLLSFSKYASLQLSAGSPYYYLAPEFVAYGGRVDQRADQFSLGALLYEFFTGKPPRKGFRPASQSQPELTEEWDDLLAKMMAPKADQRFAHFSEIRERLVELAGELPGGPAIAAAPVAAPAAPPAAEAGDAFANVLDGAIASGEALEAGGRTREPEIAPPTAVAADVASEALSDKDRRFNETVADIGASAAEAAVLFADSADHGALPETAVPTSAPQEPELAVATEEDLFALEPGAAGAASHTEPIADVTCDFGDGAALPDIPPEPAATAPPEPIAPTEPSAAETVVETAEMPALEAEPLAPPEPIVETEPPAAPAELISEAPPELPAAPEAATPEAELVEAAAASIPPDFLAPAAETAAPAEPVAATEIAAEAPPVVEPTVELPLPQPPAPEPIAEIPRPEPPAKAPMPKPAHPLRVEWTSKPAKRSPIGMWIAAVILVCAVAGAYLAYTQGWFAGLNPPPPPNVAAVAPPAVPPAPTPTPEPEAAPSPEPTPQAENPAQKIAELIQKAEAFVKQKQYAKPAGANALDLLAQIETLDAANKYPAETRAKMLADLTKRYDLAMQQGDNKQAVELAQEALLIKPNDKQFGERLAAAQKGLEGQVDPKKLAKLTNQLNWFMRHKIYVKPDGQCALATIGELEKLQPGNETAAKSRKEIVALKTKETQAAMDAHKWDDAVAAAAEGLLVDEKDAKLTDLRNKANLAKQQAAAAPTPAPVAKTCPTGMRFVAGGSFRMGSSPDDPLRKPGENTNTPTFVPAYCIDLYEYPNQPGSPPKTNISWNDAETACESVGKRLCSESEWERACKGPGNQRYPYGNDFNPNACATQGGEGQKRNMAAAGSWAQCRSTFGIYDMSGNAREWTGAPGKGAPIIKGGSVDDADWGARCAVRTPASPGTRSYLIGFRCCQGTSEEGTK